MSRAPRPIRLAAAAALTAVLVLGAVGCSKSDEAAPTDTSSDVGSPATVDASTTTTTAPTTTVATPTTLAAPVGLPKAADSAMTLYAAWKANDRAAASKVADAAAIDVVFAAAQGTYELYRGCDTGEFDTGGCLFRNRSNNDTIQIDVEKRDGNWVISGAFFSPG